MSVYTELTHENISHILEDYSLDALQSFEGIAAGIENSNFFIDTEQGRFVLTVFERMDEQELPYFMRLMCHLAAKGLSCPDVMQRRDGSLLFEVQDEGGAERKVKWGCIVSCLSGKTLDALNSVQLYASGQALAQLHLAGESFAEQRANPTGTIWLQEHVDKVLQGTAKAYGDVTANLLRDELESQRLQLWDDLPRGVIHGDLFVDNILFDGDKVSGIIDFYYAHTAPWVMDIAITLNAQAVILNHDDDSRIQAFLSGYESVRELQEDEFQALPTLLRLAALRFWVSRLYDALFPRGGAMTQTKDPEEYRLKLLFHRGE
ncbi:MAG: homoserine kinase [Mariprofundaceae bacterium]|nr:homoserine kinase [Mariprofundaceae bacterium]